MPYNLLFATYCYVKQIKQTNYVSSITSSIKWNNTASEFRAIFSLLMILMIFKTSYSQSAVRSMSYKELISESNYFKLKGKISETDTSVINILAHAIVASQFGEYSESLDLIRYLRIHNLIGNDSIKIISHEIEFENLWELDSYDSIIMMHCKFLKEYPDFKFRSSMNVGRYETSKFLSQFPKTQIKGKSKLVMKYTKGFFGKFCIKVNINGKKIKGVFDTGAGQSVIIESLAKNIRTVRDSICLGTSDGRVIYCRLGFCDSIRIDEIQIQNVYFLIVPDKFFSYGPFKLGMILGYPLIKLFKEMKFDLNRQTIEIGDGSRFEKDNCQSKYFYSENSPIIQVVLNNCDTLLFLFDSGANKTFFNSRVNNVICMQENKNKHQQILSICNKPVVFDKINSSKFKGFESLKKYDGVLGSDFLKKRNYLIINFKKHLLVIE